MNLSTNQEIWEDIFVNNDWGQYPSLALVRFIAKNFYSISNRTEIKILELGCGTGSNIWYLRREGFTTYAIDYSKTACKKAEAKLKLELLHENSFFFVGDYISEILHFENNYFDAIIDIESLYCNSFEDCKKIINTCFQKLKPGGFMFSQTFSDKTWGLNGPEISHHMVTPVEGPLAYKGSSRFTTSQDIELLYVTKLSKLKNLELQELQLMNEKHISEWLITVEKK